jgi:1-acyl-sn-glycerol-3-phosphate acyltransferase
MWTPVSGCGPHCLRDDEVRPAGPARRAARLAGLVAVLAAAAAVPLLPRPWRGPSVRGCARGALAALGIGWSVHGRLPRGRALAVANHISWLDIVVLLAIGRLRLVAKSEVRQWLLIGPVAAAVGAVFLDRSRPRTLPVAVAQARDALSAGAVVAVFPEGTTSCGEGAGAFRPAFFQAAIDARVPVVPVTLRFEAAGAPTAQPAFIGAETVLESAKRVLAMRGLRVRVCVGTAIHPGPAATRHGLAGIAALAVGVVPPRPAQVPLAPVVPFPTAVPALETAA